MKITELAAGMVVEYLNEDNDLKSGVIYNVDYSLFIISFSGFKRHVSAEKVKRILGKSINEFLERTSIKTLETTKITYLKEK